MASLRSMQGHAASLIARGRKFQPVGNKSARPRIPVVGAELHLPEPSSARRGSSSAVGDQAQVGER